MKPVNAKLILVSLFLLLLFHTISSAQMPCKMWVNNDFNENYFSDGPVIRDGVTLFWTGPGKNAFDNFQMAVEALANNNCQSKTIVIEGPTPVSLETTISCNDVTLILNGTGKLPDETSIDFLKIKIEDAAELIGNAKIYCKDIDMNTKKLKIKHIDLEAENNILNYGSISYIITNENGNLILTIKSLVFFPVGLETTYSPVEIESEKGNIFAVQTEQEPLFPGGPPDAGAGIGIKWDIEQIKGEAVANLFLIFPKNNIPPGTQPDDLKVYVSYADDGNWEEVPYFTEIKPWSDPAFLVAKIEKVTSFGTFTVGYIEEKDDTLDIILYGALAAAILGVAFLIARYLIKLGRKRKDTEDNSIK